MKKILNHLPHPAAWKNILPPSRVKLHFKQILHSVAVPFHFSNIFGLRLSRSTEGLEESSVTVSISEQLQLLLSVSPSFFNMILS